MHKLDTPHRHRWPVGGLFWAPVRHSPPFFATAGRAPMAPARSGVRWRGYALEGYAPEPFRHYAMPGGVNSHKPHGVSGLVVGNKKPPVVRPGACTYRGKYRAIELQLADPTPPVGQQLPPGQRSQPRRHCSTGSAHAGARRRSRRWRTRPTPAWG
jgi:hypothetical protein